MKKLTFASLLVTAIAISAFGQAKPGLTNNHVTSISAGAVGIKSATRSRVVSRDKVSVPETNTKPQVAQTTASYRNTPEWVSESLNGANNFKVKSAIPQPPSVNSVAATAAVIGGSTAATQLYRVGVGDVLDIQITQNRTRQSTLFTVLDGGLVDYPLVGAPVLVAGLTTSEVAARLRQQIKVFNNPTVAVKVRDYASHSVTINGFVSAPGTKTLRREAVPLYVVISEALPLPEAVQATIIRKGKAPIQVKLSDVAASATLVLPGDIIKISADSAAPSQFFYAGGELNAPGQKIFHDGLTLTQAILASGGLSKNASTAVRIARQGSDGKLVTVEHNLANIQNGKVTDPMLLKGDRIEVRAR